jgi:peroxygenase
MSGSIGGVRGGGFPELPDDDSVAGQDATPAPAAEPEAKVTRIPGAARPEGMTALQHHVTFFDGNKDGVISVAETDAAMRALGLAPKTSTPTAVVINFGLAKDTTGSLLGLKVSVPNIHQGKHAGDTDIYDEKGNFVPRKLDELWAKFDKDKDGQLTRAELDNMINVNAKDAGVKGKIAARGEFFLLLDLAGQPNAKGEKVITKERLQAFYDGTLFPQIAAERAAMGKDPNHGDVNAGIAGAARHFGGIFAGAAAGAKAGEIATVGVNAVSALAAPFVGAMKAVCPGPKPMVP